MNKSQTLNFLFALALLLLVNYTATKRINELQMPKGYHYYIRPAGSAKCLNTNASGQAVQFGGCNAKQRFVFRKNGPTYYDIVNEASGLALTEKKRWGNVVKHKPEGNRDYDQKFQFVRHGSSYQIKRYHYCLEESSGHLELQICSFSQAQYFDIIKA